MFSAPASGESPRFGLSCGQHLTERWPPLPEGGWPAKDSLGRLGAHRRHEPDKQLSVLALDEPWLEGIAQKIEAVRLEGAPAIVVLNRALCPSLFGCWVTPRSRAPALVVMTLG